MRKNSCACVVALALLAVAAPAPAQLGRIVGRGDKDKDSREKQRDRAEKEARRYDSLKTFSLDLYEKDLDFQEDVEQHYDGVQKEHSEYAFQMNVAPPARYTVVHDGDRLRLHTGLYDNKIVADYVNRIGQQLVPEDSDRLFAFRLVAHPIPFAETLSTGTIYISTGLISLIDNEAQLAYVLGHEMAHVYKDHWKLKSILALGEEEYNKKQERKRRLISLGAAVAGGVVAGAVSREAATGLQVGLASGAGAYILSHLFIRGMNLDWDKVQEDEADRIAFQAVLNRNYDVNEVPKLYLAVQRATQRDHRVGLGFLGSRKRVGERIANATEMLNGPFKAEVEQKLKAGQLVGSNPDFQMVMSELKRDNGILAFYHDMFQLAKSNLEYAVSVRDNDPAVHYYYGKVLKLVGRTDADRQAADREFVKAIQHDTRDRNYGAHLYRALALMNLKDRSQNPEIVKEMQSYLNAHFAYSTEEAMIANHLPANIDSLYDYLTQAGEVKWMPEIPNTKYGNALVPSLTPPALEHSIGVPPGAPGSNQTISSGAKAKAALGGAATGARVGSVVPGVGAGAGAVVGGAAAATGASRGTKK